MKYVKTFALLLACAGMLTACSDDDLAPGNPTMNVTGDLGQAHFGDILRFKVLATDPEVPLSTIHAELYFGDEMVTEQVIRTKESGVDYDVEVAVPYYANIPDGQATLRLTLQNIHFTLTEQIYSVSVSHADYPQLILLTEEGEELVLNRDEKYKYSLTQRFPSKVRGKIIAKPVDDNAQDIVFGYENSEVKVDGPDYIPFSNGAPGRYTISFNTLTFEGSPFVTLSFNGQTFNAIDETTSYLDLTLAAGDQIIPEGFPNYNDWWINPDYLSKNSDGSLTFNAYSGTYRFIADTQKQYFRIYKLNGSEPATLAEDGSGALWIIGEKIGQPSLANEVGWTTENALCMAPVGEKTYQITVVGGQTINTSAINFKFFGQMGWGVELGGADLTSNSPLIGVGTGDNGHDNGNLFLPDGVELQENGVYVITVDCSRGIHAAVMDVEYKGEQAFEEKPIYINGVKMSTSDNSLYTANVKLDQNSAISFREFTELDALYYDPDFFNFDEESYSITFLPVSGYYTVTLDKSNGLLKAAAVNADGSEVTLNADGTGALYMMGWGVGSPSQSYQFGWDPGKAYSLAQIRPGVYQFTGKAGPENNSSFGDRYRADYLSFKFFHQNGWGGEFGQNSMTMTGNTTSLLSWPGNIELAQDVTLEEGATYRMTIDLSAGIENGKLTFEKI